MPLKIPGLKTGRARLRAVVDDTHGAATIEAVIWLPVFFFIFALIADTSMIFGSESQVLRVIQDANRNLSTGYSTTTAQISVEIKVRISSISPNAVVTSTIVGNLITTSVVMPLTDITATGLVYAFTSGSVTVSAQHVMEGV